MKKSSESILEGYTKEPAAKYRSQQPFKRSTQRIIETVIRLLVTVKLLFLLNRNLSNNLFEDSEHIHFSTQKTQFFLHSAVRNSNLWFLRFLSPTFNIAG